MAEEKSGRIPSKSFNIEALVGLFMVVGLLCLGYLAVNLAGMKVFRSGVYEVKALFGDISGLEVGAPVEIAGVPVGEVSSIDLNEDTAIVFLELQNGIVIHDDDIFSIRTKGIIGDRYVKIKPGASEEVIGAGGTVTETVDVVDFESIVEKFIHSLSSDEE